MNQSLVGGFVSHVNMTSQLAELFGIREMGCVTVVGKDHV